MWRPGVWGWGGGWFDVGGLAVSAGSEGAQARDRSVGNGGGARSRCTGRLVRRLVDRRLYS